MADRIGHGPNCAYCSSTRGPASCPALPPDRPRIRTMQYARRNPRRITVWRDQVGSWWVHRGRHFQSLHATHAEAITAADKLARQH